MSLEHDEDGSAARLDWLVFSKPISLAATSTFYARIAFRLDTESGRLRVIPQESTPLYVYFATEKETHLGFLVQGPYFATPARDNIMPNDPRNISILADTSELLVDSLTAMKEQGLLTAGVLETLPILPAHFPENSFLRPLYEAVQRALLSRDLLPTAEGAYINAERAILAR